MSDDLLPKATANNLIYISYRQETRKAEDIYTVYEHESIVLCENPNWLPLHFRQLKAAFGKYSLAHTL
jgi:hypothetical protein